MSGIEIGLVSVVLIVFLIYIGLYVPVALGLVSFIGVWVIKGNVQLPVYVLAQAASNSISDSIFATVPLFALMGLFVSQSGLGRDVYRVANAMFYRIRGGLGVATVAANAIFASITGSSIASASVFTKVSVPEMRRFNYTARFSVGVVAGSSVLGMLIPPSVMLILYAIVAEQSVGQMFMAGIIPGILLSVAFCALILVMAYRFPKFVGGGGGIEESDAGGEDWKHLTPGQYVEFLFPIVLLVVVVLGGLYGGVVTPAEAGAAGAAAALLIALAKRRLTLRGLWEVLVETGHITSSILFLIISASMYSRMLGIAGLPTLFGEWLIGMNLDMLSVMAIYVVLLLMLGTILDTASIILIVVPLFLPALEPFGINLVWFGIVTVVGAEIGLLTPPLGISCFVIKSTLNDPSISLFDIFAGAFPFAVIMLIVLIFLILYPQLSLFLV